MSYKGRPSCRQLSSEASISREELELISRSNAQLGLALLAVTLEQACQYRSHCIWGAPIDMG